MKKKNLLIILLLVITSIAAQTPKDIEFYKSKFFEFPKIGVDSSLIFTNKIFQSKKPIDLAFAYAAKRQLLALKNVPYNEQEYLKKIEYYTQLSKNDPNNIFDLANVYNIKANTFKLRDELKKSLESFLISEKYALEYDDLKQIIKVKGNVAAIQGDIGLHDDCLKNLIKIYNYIENNKEELGAEYYDQTGIRTILNISSTFIERYRTKKNIKDLDSSEYYLKQINPKTINDQMKAVFFVKKGVLNFELKKFNSSVDFFKQSVRFYKKVNMENENEMNYYNIGLCYFRLKKIDDAKKYFFLVLKTNEDKSNFNYLFTLKYLSSIYTIQKNDSSSIYLDKFIEIYDKKNKVEKQDFAQSFNMLEKKNLNEEINDLKKSNNYNIYIIISIVLLGSIGFYFYRKNQKKEMALKMEAIMKEINKPQSKEAKTEIIITDENEAFIVNSLNKLETDRYFLSKNFSLQTVAKKIGTNATYLTKIVQKHKEANFNDYTNDLRINFILNEFMTNKKLHHYTTQSLAEYVGYKNGDSFTKIFKKKTGLTPFQFIKNL